MRPGFCGLLLLSAGVAHAAAPPLKPKEEIVKTADGCGMVIESDHPLAVYSRKNIPEVAWGGACIDGLAMGEGVLSPRRAFPDGSYMEPIRGWTWYGRRFGGTEVRWSNGGVTHGFTWEGKSVSYTSLDPTQVTWSKSVGLSSSVGDGDTAVVATSPATVFVSQGTKYESLKCPNPDSPEGCDRLWTQHAGPVIERIKAFIAKNEPKAKARRREVEPIVAQWKKQVGSKLVASGAAVAAQLNEQTTQNSELRQRCFARAQQARQAFIASEDYDARSERLVRELQQAYSGECESDPTAAEALAAAERDARERRASDEQSRKQWEAWERETEEWNKQHEQQQAAERSQRRRETVGAILEGVAMYQGAKHTFDQREAAEAQAKAQQAQQAATTSQQAQQPAHSASYQAQPAQQVASQQQTSEPWKSPEDIRREAAREQAVRERDQQFEANAAQGAVASNCIRLASTTSYGGFKNTCGFKVDFVYCTLGSTGEELSNFSDGCDCHGKLFCSGVIKPYSESAGLTSGAKQVLWGACKEPYTALKRGFNGREILYDCKR